MGVQSIFSLEKELEARYGAAFARGICDSLASARKIEEKQKDIGALAQSLARGRGRVRAAAQGVRTWKVEYALASENAAKRHLAAEGAVLRRTLEDMIAVYRAISKDYHAMRRENPGRLFRTETPSGCAVAA